MSMDAGGLAQMAYNSFSADGGLGVPGSGFASRGKGGHIKRLSVPAQSNNSAIDQGQGSGIAAPRTSRSHLLAGLRTAPKSPMPGPPSTAPLSQTQNRFGLQASKYSDHEGGAYGRGVPQTAATSNFPGRSQSQYGMNNRQMYSLPEQVLAPPAIQVSNDQYDENMDPNLYAELVATNLYLAQQQQRLQQQLINVTAAAQQFQGMTLGNGMNVGQQTQLMSPNQNAGFYGQQLQAGMQPVIQMVPNQPGVYSVYNPMTGQQGFFVDPNYQQSQLSASSPTDTNQGLSYSPPVSETPTFRAQVSPPPPSNSASAGPSRSVSPPKATESPQNVEPLPPPSANAFRPGHKKSTSLALSLSNNSASRSEGPKTGNLKSAGFNPTPVNGTFGPGQGRVGEHPLRQPRGPPPLEELMAKPTTKHEGSKNFSTRQRRRAVHSLVRAGIERRGVRGNGSTGSAGSMTPVSEAEISFSVSSDNDSDSIRSGSLSGKPSIGSLRAAANGAIGSERKASRERSSIDSTFTATSISSDEGMNVGGKLLEVKVDSTGNSPTSERRKTPMLVLTSAEKRKSSVF
ncbi:MAG: hypothetical protein M1819_005668 [Sarea resinae]|nr:MAG: hypothetical protein M1819_005668 [Sarea resinae]